MTLSDKDRVIAEIADDSGELPFGVRWGIQRATAAHLWPRLELASARRVAHLAPLRHLVDLVLATAEQRLDDDSLHGVVDLHSVRLYDEAVAALATEAGSDRRPYYAAFAVVTAAQAANRDPLLALGVPEGLADPDSWSAAYHACLAWSGSAPWERVEASVGPRRAWWTWWAETAARGGGLPDTEPLSKPEPIVEAISSAASTTQVPPEQVLERAMEIGFTFPSGGAYDVGQPGRLFASHSECQLACLKPGESFAVSRPPCPSCRAFLQALADALGASFDVRDPSGRTSFRPRGGPRGILGRFRL